MNKEGLLRISNHEMSHLVVYLFLGGSPDAIKNMQIKQKVGYFDQTSIPIANNNFARACVSLAGPVSDKMIGVDYKGCDLSNAKIYIGYASAELTMSEDDQKCWSVSEFQRAWNFTQDILVGQKELIDKLRIVGLEMINGSNLITGRKLKKLAMGIISQWNELNVGYYSHPSLVK